MTSATIPGYTTPKLVFPEGTGFDGTFPELETLKKLDALRAELKAIKSTHQQTARELRSAEVRLLSKARASKRLGIGNETLTYLIRSKQLGTVKVGKRVKIPTADVERLASQGFKSQP